MIGDHFVMKGELMHILLLLLLPYIIFGASLRAMEEEQPLLSSHLSREEPNIQELGESDGDIEKGFGPSSTNSISSLSSFSGYGSYIVHGSQTRSITEQNYNVLRTDITVLQNQMASVNTQIAQLSNKIGRMKGESEVIGGARICNGVVTSICILLLWGIVGAEYFGLTVSL